MAWKLAGFDPQREASGYHYDAELAERPVGFFRECLTHVVGDLAGEPFELEQWQADIVRTLFGWVDDNNVRRFRRAYIEVPRKNGKTSLCAAIALYVLFCDRVFRNGEWKPEGGAECYCAAATRDQAGLLFRIACGMVRQNAKLEELCKVYTTNKTILRGESFLRAIPADEGSVHGQNAHLIIADELHVWKNEEFYDGLVSGRGSRTQPLLVEITTAGWDRHSICWKEHSYAEQLRDGKINDPQFLPILWGVEEEDDWEDEATWQAANPNIGVSVSWEYLRGEYNRARNQPSYQNTFRRLYLNQWTSQETRFLDMGEWRACEATERPLEDETRVWGGLDLSASTDLTSLCWVAEDGDTIKADWRFWIPEDRLRDLEKRDSVPYSAWVDAGYVELCAGSASIDYEQVLNAILADAKRLKVISIGFDPYLAEVIRQRLEDEGIVCHKVPQTIMQLSAPTKELEKLVLEKQLDHGGNPVAQWNAENLAVKIDANNNLRPVKPDYHSSPKKIDGMVALINALHSRDHVPDNLRSMYLEPGSLAL